MAEGRGARVSLTKRERIEALEKKIAELEARVVAAEAAAFRRISYPYVPWWSVYPYYWAVPNTIPCSSGTAVYSNQVGASPTVTSAGTDIYYTTATSSGGVV